MAPFPFAITDKTRLIHGLELGSQFTQTLNNDALYCVRGM